jgi:5-methylcytosine-specific restriction endonuclease McrA
MSNEIHGQKWRTLREQVFREYGTACAYCGYEDSVMTVDHIIPRSKWPKYHGELIASLP